jgi:hypothetical protein
MEIWKPAQALICQIHSIIRSTIMCNYIYVSNIQYSPACEGKGQLVRVLDYAITHQSMKIYRDMRYILKLGARWRWVVSFKSWQLYPGGKISRYTLERRTRGLECRTQWLLLEQYHYPKAIISIMWIRSESLRKSDEEFRVQRHQIDGQTRRYRGAFFLFSRWCIKWEC